MTVDDLHSRRVLRKGDALEGTEEDACNDRKEEVGGCVSCQCDPCIL